MEQPHSALEAVLLENRQLSQELASLKQQIQAYSLHPQQWLEELERTKADLVKEQAFLRSIYEGVGEAIFVVAVLEHDFRYISLNPAAEQLTQISSAAIRGKTPEDIFPSAIAATVRRRYQDCLRIGARITYEEYLPLKPASWWLTSLKPLRDNHDRIYRIVGISINITDRKQIEQELEMRVAVRTAQLQEQTQSLSQLNSSLAQTTQLLQQRNQELDQFAYAVSHDLKAPLRAISQISEWIEEDLQETLPSENQQQLHLLRRRVLRMQALIDGLLNYSRVGRVKATVSQVDVSTLLNEVLDSLAPPPAFQIVLAPDMPILQAHRIPLMQVFANLISNAIQHHDRAEGQITITVKDQTHFYQFAVQDDGPGIAPAAHSQVFEVFQTLKPADKNETTGIGLAIVKKIVETEGGSIRLESELDQGATFRFTWPKQPIESI